MHPKTKLRATGGRSPTGSVKPLLLHEVVNPSASAAAASRRRLTATQPASGRANHARHHVSRQAQS